MRTVVDPGHVLLAVSCSATSFCLAGDDAGSEVDGNPTQPATFTLTPTGDSAPLEAVDCTAVAHCIVGDLGGDALVGIPGIPGSPGHVHVGAPTISGAQLTFSRSGRPALHFSSTPGVARPRCRRWRSRCRMA